MMPNRSMPPGPVVPELAYADVPAASRWLCEAFGLTERLRIGGHRIQLRVGDGAIVAVEAGGEAVPAGRVLVPVADVDSHCARARRAGARVVNEPATHPFGERQYSALDLAGHRWTFSQSVFDADPASWGGELVGP
jgi:uncharacterized glyoxalase superfamily protein PhnB